MYHYTVMSQNGISSLRNLVIINTLSKSLKKTHILHTIGNSELECASLFGLPNKYFYIVAPWDNFNNHRKIEIIEKEHIKELEKTYSSVYNKLQETDKRILSSLVMNFINEEWKSSFVIVENKNNELISKAVEIAKKENIEVFDLSNKEHLGRVQSKIIKTEKQYEKAEEQFLSTISEKPYKNIVCKLIK